MSGMPLSAVSEGSDVVIMGFRGGARFVQKLADMGFVPGTELKVIRNQREGPMIVLLRGMRLAIGRGIATKIDVSPKA